MSYSSLVYLDRFHLTAVPPTNSCNDNSAEDAFLVRPEFEAIAKQYPDRFPLHYTLDNHLRAWA